MSGPDQQPETSKGEHGSNATITLIPVTGIGEIAEGDDVAAEIIANVELFEDDVVVITSKVISKAEGRLIPAPNDPEQRDAFRRTLIEQETVRILATRGRTWITEGRLGIVQAAAGVDGSNIAADSIALLPTDPDGAAADIRAAIAQRVGVNVGVVITDTMGRAWRNGQIDAAIGAAGLAVLHPYEGQSDKFGNPLVVTEIAIADEIAAAADLVKGKLTGTPVAIVRGLTPRADGSNARTLIRAPEDDLFGLGAAEARAAGAIGSVPARRSVRQFSDEPVPEELLRAAIAAARTAPAPHHSHPIEFVWVRDRRIALLDALQERWRDDLEADGRPADEVKRRIDRGGILYRAPELVVPICTFDGAHEYPDTARNAAERTMFTVAGGAAVQSLLIALAARGLGSCWIGSTIFAPDVTREVLELDRDNANANNTNATSAANYQPLGAIAIGYPLEPAPERPPATPGDGLILR